VQDTILEYTKEKERKDIMLKGQSPTPEQRTKISAGIKKYYSNPANREKLRQKALARWKNPDFHNQQIARMTSEEYKARQRASHLGIPHTAKWRKSLSLAMKGKAPSQATKDGYQLYHQANPISNFKSKQHTKHARQLMSKSQRKRLADPTNHPMWLGGISFIPYPVQFNDKLKEAIRSRDNYRCQICGRKQKDCYRKLDIHHIDFDKLNCNPTNLQSTCISCHARLHRIHYYTQRKILSEKQVAEWLYSHGIGPDSNEGYKHLLHISVDGTLLDCPVEEINEKTSNKTTNLS